MKPGVGIARSTDKVINNGECVDRILSIVEQLQDQIHETHSDVQLRIKRAVEEQQHSLEEAYRRQQEQAVSQAKEETRKQVTQVLSSRFDLEVSKLNADFDRRIQDLLAENGSSSNEKIEHA